MKTPAQGERAAVLGYSAQYLVAAELIYDALLDGRLEWLALADPDAGRVDDFQLATPGALDAFQIKWHQFPTALTWSQFKGSTGLERSGLAAHLADGWQRLRRTHTDRRVRVHLVTNSYASTSSGPPSLGSPGGGARHFAAFIEGGWRKPIAPDNLPRAGAWEPALAELRDATGLADEEFGAFRENCVLRLEHRLPEDADASGSPMPTARVSDIRQIAALLFHTVGRERQVVRLDRVELLRRLGWQGRFEFRARHEFPIGTAYEPIEKSARELRARLQRHRSGYLALVGTPGSGKSTLLTATLRYQTGFRVVRYYCFVPNDARLSRGEAADFLHDLVLALWREGVRPRGSSIGRTLEELRVAFEAQLADLHARWKAHGERTIILVDGLDHVEREQNPARSLLEELPSPTTIPDGVLLVLGSQRVELQGLNPRIIRHLSAEDRLVRMSPLSRRAIRSIASAAGPRCGLGEDDLRKIEELSTGHPLALSYLLNRLRHAPGAEDVRRALREAPPYSGRIEDDYAIYWDQIVREGDVHDLLALLSRMRGPLDMHLAVKWVGEATVKKLTSTGQHYFERVSPSTWRFFHNSFRQFVLDRTGRSLFGETDAAKHRAYHRRLAEFASGSDTPPLFAWERIYHLFCAGEYGKVLRAGTQASFRGQFLALRPVSDIRDDIALVIRAAREGSDPLAIIRMLLIDEEVSERAYALNQVDVPGLLLDLGDVETAVAAVLRERGLCVGEARALEFAAELAARGHQKPSLTVFEAAEPLELISSGDGVELGDRESVGLLEAWVAAAAVFRPVPELVEVIARLRVKRREHRHAEDPQPTRRDLRLRLLIALADALVEAGNQGAAEELQALLADDPDGQVVVRRLHIATLATHPGTDWAAHALDRLLEEHDREPLPASICLLVAGAALRARGDASTAERVVAGLDRPERLTERESSASTRDMTSFMPRVRFNRLLAALGRPVPAEAAVRPSKEKDKEGDVLLERMLVLIANVWGAAWKGECWLPAQVVRVLTPAVLLYERSLREKNHWITWHTFRGITDEYFELLIHAAAAHGRAAVVHLGEWLEARWRADATRRFWSPGRRRDIALALFRADGDRTRLVARLESVQEEMDGWCDLHERIEAYVAQARAWAEAGEGERARRLLPEVLAGSFGIHHGKDIQLGRWVEWFTRILQHSPALAAPDMPVFAAGVASAAAAGRGYDSTEAAMDLLTAIARFDAATAEQLRAWFLDQGALEFVPGIESLCLAALQNAATDPVTAFAVIRRVCLPYQKGTNAELAEALATRLLALEDRVEAEHLGTELLTAVDTDCARGNRRPWWRAFAENSRCAAHDALRQPFRARLAAAEPERLDYTPGSVTLRDGEVIEEPQLQHRVASAEDLIALLDQLADDRFRRWRDLVRRVLPELDEAKALRLLDGLQRVGGRVRDAAPIIERLREIGRADAAEAQALQALAASAPVGWLVHYDGGSRVLPYQILVRTNGSKYGPQALAAFVDDYLGEVRNPRDLVRQLDELVAALWGDPPLVDLWREIREHVLQLDEFAKPSTSPPELPVGTAPNPRTAPQVLVRVLSEAYRLPLMELRDDAYKGLVWLAAHSTEAAALVAEEARRLVDGDGEGSLLGLSLLEGLAEVLPGTLGTFRTELLELSRSVDAAERMAACGLLNQLGISPLAVPPERRRLPITYRIDLPEYATEKHQPIAAVLAPGAPLPDTMDPLELIGIARDGLDLLSRATGIPFRNLVERTVTLMRTVQPVQHWNAAAERELMERFRTTGIETAFVRPRAGTAMRALSYVVAELRDAGVLDEDMLRRLRPALAPRDARLARVDPGAGMWSPVAITLPDDWSASPEKWFDEPILESSVPPPSESPEWTVLGFLTEAEKPIWEMPREMRCGGVCSPHVDRSFVEDQPERIIPCSLWWRADEYPDLHDLKHALGLSLLLRALPQRVEIGRAGWLALNPLIGNNLGWRPSDGGLFRWMDDEGQTMVETVWWRDGRLGRHPHWYDVRAEGWLVRASAPAVEAIRRRAMGGRWVQGTTKGYKPHGSEHRTERSSVLVGERLF